MLYPASQHPVCVPSVQPITSAIIQQQKELQQQQQHLQQQQQQLQQQLQFLHLQGSVLQKQLQHSQLDQHQVQELSQDKPPHMSSSTMSNISSGGIVTISQQTFFPTSSLVTSHMPFSMFSPLSPHNSSTPSTMVDLPQFTPPPDIPLPHTQIDTAKMLAKTQCQLEQTGWYHTSLSWQQSATLLQNSSPGTFLVRSSQNPGFLYSLSVQRGKEGPTSIRIHFSAGKFQLDAEESISHMMPAFDSVGELVEHYVSLSRNKQNSEDMVDPREKCDMKKVSFPIVLDHPLYKEPPSLTHLSRLAINRAMASNTTKLEYITKEKSIERKLNGLELPSRIVEYIRSYPLKL